VIKAGEMNIKKLDLKTIRKKLERLLLIETDSGGRRINKKAIYWAAVLFLVFITFWLGHFYKSGEKRPEEKIVPVEVEVVRTGSIEGTIEVTGWMKANQIVDIKSKVSGRIESLRAALDNGGSVDVEEGLVVKKGQPLAVIDHDVYLTEVAAARANVRAAEVELADAEREKKRMIALYKGGSSTEQSMDKAVTAAGLAEAHLNSARANLELAEINLRESTIVSPIDGIVTARHIDQGNLVNAGDRIVTVAEMKTIKVIVAVSEKYGSEIVAGMSTRIRLDAFPDRVFDAKVYSVYPSLDLETHTIQVEIKVENSRFLLKPGMFARVSLIMEQKDDVVVILRDVVLGGKIDKHYVYVVEDAIARKRFVEVGITEAERCEITDGLKAGQTLVVNGMNYLADGMSVEVVRIEDIK
jgi:membrane fusion protein (multidrug efflux system)